MYWGSMESGNTYLIRKKYSRDIIEIKVIEKTQYCFKIDWGKKNINWITQTDIGNEYDIIEDLGRDKNRERIDKIDEIFE